ncbi:MAG: phosphomannomutase/phosphoglucomutase [Bacilli bacterium]|nr:phosphomannomutase/phosphoglucomutase [Bacilli bacterium]
MNINIEMFREYDIRGIFGQELNGEVAYLIGKAFGTKMRELNIPTTVVGYDNRLSSVELENNLVKGILETGSNVIRLGLVTTPMCYYAANLYNTNCSMMITASHNPKEYNGFKFSYNGVHNAYGKSVKEIYEIIQKGEFAVGEGKEEARDIKDAYIYLVTRNLTFGGRKIKVVYDCGNGTASVIANEIFSEFRNIESIGICNVSDGNFPSHHPDPCVEENLTMLKEKVKEVGADVGIGYDGDCDRVGFVDENGTFIEMDKFLIIMWKHLINNVNKKECLYDVKCSKALEDELKKLGVKTIEYRTGNSYTRAGSAEGDYPLSGELSGHVYFRDRWPGYDDGIYAGMRLIEMLSYTDKPLSSFLNDIVKYYSTPEIKVKVEDSKKFEIVSKMEEYVKSKGYNYITIDGVKTKFDDGFALVRASNTGPNLTMRFEATTEERLKEIQEEFTNELNKYIN